MSGAYQGLYPELWDVPRSAAKLAVEGAAWYERKWRRYLLRAATMSTRCSAKSHATNLYQASIYAWNAVTSVKYDTKKGRHTVAA